MPEPAHISQASSVNDVEMTYLDHGTGRISPWVAVVEVLVRSEERS